MKKIIFIVLILSLVNCASALAVRTQFSNGEDDRTKITRIVVPVGLAVLSVNSVKPSMSQIFDNRYSQSTITKSFNLLPGKHTLEIGFANRDIESKNTQMLNIEVKARELYYICYEKNLTTWKPTALRLTEDQYEEAEIMGGYNYALKKAEDSKKCFPK